MASHQSLVSADEIKRYDEAVAALARGDLDSERFMAFRLQHGVYGQRQDGYQMVRIKIPGGRLQAVQLPALAAALERYSEQNTASVTTRQDIQLHFVRLDETPALLHDLGEAGLTTREACGNTVRNITACPLAGVCVQEHTDVMPFVEATAARFLRHPLTQHLPRKFKISFSGCEADCAMGLMHDIGVVATQQNGRYGFRVMAGGGLGHKPREAITVEPFIEEAALLPVLEALIALHNQHSDRKRRAKARLKFLLEKFGVEGFLRRYRAQRQRSEAAFAEVARPHSRWHSVSGQNVCGAGAPRQVVRQKQPGLYAIPIQLPLGQITSSQLRGLAELMMAHHLSEVRAAVDQNLILLQVPGAQLETITTALGDLGLGQPRGGENVVACPGTRSCRLGITASKRLAADLHGGDEDLRLRVSGCHNSCGQHHVADIGLHGEGQRIHGKLIPSYVLHLGGDGMGGGALALKGPTVPAMRITNAIDRIKAHYRSSHSQDESFVSWVRHQGVAYFDDLLADLTTVNADDAVQLARDYGEEQPFSVLQLGGGECAGAAQDFVASHFSAALHERNYRDAFAQQNHADQALECATQMMQNVVQALVFVGGHQAPATLERMSELLPRVLARQSQLADTFNDLFRQLTVLGDTFDGQQYGRFSQQLDQWVGEAAHYCQAQDQQLDLASELSEPTVTTEVGVEIDLSTYACPLHYIKARNELRKLASGHVIKLLLASGEATEQVSATLLQEGHAILTTEARDTLTCITVKKAETVAQAG